MEFRAHCTPKRHGFKGKINTQPFPRCAEGQQRLQSVFTGLSVEVKEPAQIREISSNGCYGKGSMSRGEPTAISEGETLLLGLEEAAFLAYYLEVLTIKDNNVEMNWEAFRNTALQLNERFIEHLAVYIYLKAKNWVIKSGIKFGGEFLIYKQDPRYYHASFLVTIITPDKGAYFLPKNIKGVQRVAETSDKDVLILQVKSPAYFAACSASPRDLQNLTINETVIRRFNYNSFAQSGQE